MFCDKISSPVDTIFSDWLLEEMNKRGWSQADLARASGLNRQVISNYINSRRNKPEPDALVALAHGMKMSPIVIFRKAGLLPAEGGDQLKFEDWKYILEELPEEEQEELRKIAEMKIEKYRKDKGLKRLSPRKAG